MRIISQIRSCILATTFAAMFSSPTFAQTAYLVFEIPGLPNEAVSGSLVSVDDQGVCIGVWYDDQGNANEFLWAPQQTDDTPAGYTSNGIWWHTEPGDVNIDNLYARQGWRMSPSLQIPRPVAAIWDPGTPQIELGTLGGESSATRGIADDERIVGWSESQSIDTYGNPQVRGFTWDNANGMVQIDPPSGFEHLALSDIHPDQDIIIGTAWTYTQTGWSSYAPLGDETSDIYAASAAVVRTPQGVEVLDARLPAQSTWQTTGANAINSVQWIAGSASDSTGMIRPVLLVPNKADINKDGSIDTNDLIQFLDAYASGSPFADTNNDGIVDQSDLDTFQSDLQAGTGSGQAMSVSSGAQPAPRPVPVNCLRRATNSNCQNCSQWNSDNPGTYSKSCNPNCYGCSGCDENNPNRPHGAPGWPGSDPKNPDAPNGGPGGNGCNSDGFSNFNSPGNGGDGGDGADGGNGGRGGDGGQALDGSGLRGGQGGNGGNGSRIGGNGGNGGTGGKGDGFGPGGKGGNGGLGANGSGGLAGGTGGNGGNGGESENGTGGAGGTGGSGGAGGIAGGNAGQGGSGGNGGNSGTGNGGQGGTGGSGATGASNGSNGGAGGQGGDSTIGTGGNGGTGGTGGGGAPGGVGGNGGPGGAGGTGGTAQGEGGDGGQGGNRGGSGGSGGDGTPPGDTGAHG